MRGIHRFWEGCTGYCVGNLGEFGGKTPDGKDGLGEGGESATDGKDMEVERKGRAVGVRINWGESVCRCL